MVGQEEIAERKKHKSSKSDMGSKIGQKRKRSNGKSSAQVDEHVLRILTGNDTGDDEMQSSPSAARPESVQPGEDATPGDADDRECKGDADKNEESGKAADTTVSDSAVSTFWSRTLSESHSKKLNITVLLESANLETVKQGGRSGGVVLLNCDDHRHLLKKSGREANDARPDITHQCLLALIDSPLNKSGRLKVFIRTAKNVLIEVHPQTRIPRTIRRFSGLMAELLEKFKVRGTSGSTPLLKVIRNPITSHLPVGTRKIVCTYNTENVVDIREHAGKMAALVAPDKGTGAKMERGEQVEVGDDAETVNVLYVIGAMAHGKVTEDWADEYICISEYPLSAATVCSRLTYTYETLFGIL